MFEDVEKIVLSGEDFPIKCDILVLEKIQNKYGELGSFENGISGFTPKVDENGEEVRNDEGLLIGTYGMPNLEMLNDALVWFVKEGIKLHKIWKWFFQIRGSDHLCQTGRHLSDPAQRPSCYHVG